MTIQQTLNPEHSPPAYHHDAVDQTDFKAIAQDKPSDRTNVLRLKLLYALDDESSDPFYIADLLIQFKKASGIRTWSEVARQLDRTPSTVTGYLSVRRCPPHLKPRMEGLSPSIVRLICGMKFRTGMEQAMEFAHSPISGRKPTMREVWKFIQHISAAHHRPRPRNVAFTFNELPMTFCLKESDTVRSVTQNLSDLISKLNSVASPEDIAVSVLKHDFLIKRSNKPRRGF
jgi:hypothetical protein